MMALDLHCHSTASDGALAPDVLMVRAADRGCRVLALTDHDCTQGVAVARQVAQQHGLYFLAGVEISVTWRKRTLHIVGLGIDETHPELQAGLLSIRQGRIERARQMAADLERVGIVGAFDGAKTHCANLDMIGRTHIARHLVATGVCKDVAAVFRKYLVEGKPGYVKHEWAQLADAVAWIRAAGGVAVLAHPGRYPIGKQLMSELLQEFISYGGEALEVVSGSHSEDDNRLFARYARQYELLASAGSDFHGPGEGGRDIGWTQPLPADVVSVCSRFAGAQAALEAV